MRVRKGAAPGHIRTPFYLRGCTGTVAPICGDFGNPEELVGPLLLLCAPAAGSFVTGAELYVDGGFTGMRL